MAIAFPALMNPYQATDTVQVFMLAGDTIARIKWVAFSDIQPLTIRQYAGIRPQGIASSQNHMFFYTDIEPLVRTAYNYDLDLYYRNNWTGTNPSENNLRLTQSSPTNTWNIPSFSSADPLRNILSGQQLTSFSSFSGTDLNNPMPVKLLSFNGTREKNAIRLTWVTATEINNKGFEVQRSVDGINFEPIGFVKGNGNQMPGIATYLLILR